MDEDEGDTQEVPGAPARGSRERQAGHAARGAEEAPAGRGKQAAERESVSPDMGLCFMFLIDC